MGEVIAVTEYRRAYFTVAGLAAYLRVSERKVWNLLADGSLPSHKVHGSRRIDPEDVDSFLAANREERTVA